MAMVLCDQSAMGFWRSGHPVALSRPEALGSSELPRRGPGERFRDLDRARYGLGAGPVHLLVGGAGERRNSAGVRCRIARTPLPPGSLVRVDDGTYVSSPELLFLQMARHLDVPQLAVLGCELCGACSEGGPGGAGLRGREPLATPAGIAAYLSAAGGAHGVRKARAPCAS